MCGSPNMTAFAFTSEKINVFALADLMEEKGMFLFYNSVYSHVIIMLDRMENGESS